MEDLLPGLSFSSNATCLDSDSADNLSPAKSFSLKFLLFLSLLPPALPPCIFPNSGVFSRISHVR